MKRLWQRLGLASPEVGPGGVANACAESVARVANELRREGRLRSDWHPFRVELPRLYEEVLEVALQAHRRPELLHMHFFDGMPRLRVEQTGVEWAPESDFLHCDLDWKQLPRLTEALNSFADLLEAHDIPLDVAWSYPSIDALQDNVRTLANWMETLCFGASFPLLYAYPGDLEAYASEVRASGDFWSVLDRRFTHPLVHELSHFGRRRAALFPPILDESISAYLGYLACPSLVLPQKGENNGLMGAAFFTQVGQAFVRNFGLRETLKAHVGVTSFVSLLGRSAMANIERLGWSQLMESEDVSLLPGHDDPSLWQKVFYLLGAGQSLEECQLADLRELTFAEIPAGEISGMDQVILRDAIQAMCLFTRLEGASYRVERSLPSTSITVDLVTCSLGRSRDPNDATHADPVYFFPPPIAAMLRERGIERLELKLHCWKAIDELVSALFYGNVDVRSELFDLRVSTAEA